MPYIADGILKKLIDADSRKYSVFSLEKGFLGWAQCVRLSIPTEYSDAMNACNFGGRQNKPCCPSGGADGQMMISGRWDRTVGMFLSSD